MDSRITQAVWHAEKLLIIVFQMSEVETNSKILICNQIKYRKKRGGFLNIRRVIGANILLSSFAVVLVMKATASRRTPNCLFRSALFEPIGDVL